MPLKIRIYSAIFLMMQLLIEEDERGCVFYEILRQLYVNSTISRVRKWDNLKMLFLQQILLCKINLLTLVGLFNIFQKFSVSPAALHMKFFIQPTTSDSPRVLYLNYVSNQKHIYIHPIHQNFWQVHKYSTFEIIVGVTLLLRQFEQLDGYNYKRRTPAKTTVVKYLYLSQKVMFARSIGTIPTAK